ncbi:hypothetical protein FBALC1_04742 [Flavobacteriales bacterium ALC-1]|nr:hypothetical protein FBALC1_04742 [Flavobacteriales bacterium ALC-1]
MKKYLITTIIFLTLLSCDNKVIADFEITNNTGFKIDSLKVEPMVILNGDYISLNKNETKLYKADMTGIVKTDGSYRLTYHQKGKTKIEDFGYYTNGYPTEKLTMIVVEVDTLKFNAEFENY